MTGDEVRILRDDEFRFIHDVHGEVCILSDTAKEPLAQLIDKGHIVDFKDTAMVEIGTTGYEPMLHLWIEIGIRRESVEIVSRTLFRRSNLNVYLSIRLGGLVSENHVLNQVFNKWKTSKQFIMEAATAAGGACLSPPADVINLELYEHQKQGLRWMVDREEWPSATCNEDGECELPPFWEEKDGVYRAELSSFLTLKRPQMIRGGILADESGMGKTLTLLSLIAYTKTNHSSSHTNYYGDDQHCMLSGCGNKSKGEDDSTTSHLKKKQKVDDLNFEWRPTLVVCPPSVLATWKKQIEQCTWPGSLTVCTYHGTTMTHDPNLLRQHDLVLTTYNIVVSEEESDAGILNKIDWWRVVLDDVHVLKGFTSPATTPFINLNAKRRWAVTGKPVHEDYENYNICPIMAYLHVHPYCDKLDVQNFFSRRLARSAPMLRLEVLMGIFSLRRTMPAKFIQNHMVVLSKDERDVYDSFEAEAKREIVHGRRYLKAAVLRLWQSCNSLALFRLSCEEMVSSNNCQDLSSRPELLKKWIKVLQEEKDYCCPVCLDQPKETVITRCTHLFCKSCVMNLIERHKGSKPVCPICRRSLNKCDIFYAQSEQFVVEKIKSLTEEGSSSNAKMSSKISALLSSLLKSKTEDPNRKSVVISQFQRMLILVDGVLSEAGYNVRRMDVIDNAKTKDKTVNEFSNAESPVVLLTSFKALSNTPGLDLSAASNLYLMEPCWNAHTEEEALSCIHQLRKKEDVKFIRFVCKNSIEERVLEIRKEKPAYGSTNSMWEVTMNEKYIEQLLGGNQYQAGDPLAPEDHPPADQIDTQDIHPASQVPPPQDIHPKFPTPMLMEAWHKLVTKGKNTSRQSQLQSLAEQFHMTVQECTYLINIVNHWWCKKKYSELSSSSDKEVCIKLYDKMISQIQESEVLPEPKRRKYASLVLEEVKDMVLQIDPNAMPRNDSSLEPVPLPISLSHVDSYKARRFLCLWQDWAFKHHSNSPYVKQLRKIGIEVDESPFECMSLLNSIRQWCSANSTTRLQDLASPKAKDRWELGKAYHKVVERVNKIIEIDQERDSYEALQWLQVLKELLSKRDGGSRADDSVERDGI